MPTLLYIPRELRDAILDYAVLGGHPAPRTVAAIEAQDRRPLSGRHSSNVFYTPNSATPRATPLLLTCRQLNDETKSLLKRTGIKYELDVKFVYENYLVPTWVHVPILTHHVEHVHATFQTLGGHQKKVFFNQNPLPDIWRWMWRAPRDMSLVSDSRGRHVVPSEDFTIGCLELDFISPEDEDQKWGKSATLRRNPGRDIDEGEMLRPEWLEADLRNLVTVLLDMGYHTSAYGGILHKRIGRIVFKVNGNVTEEFDIGQMLADLKFNDSFGHMNRSERVDHWIEWKERAMQRRKEFGLKTAEFREGWKEEAAADAARKYIGRWNYD